MLSALKSAKRAGASILSVNPLLETGMREFRHPQSPRDLIGSGFKISDDHLDININGDMALFRAIGSIIVERNMHDLEFINEHTTGFAEYRKVATEVDWVLTESLTGHNRERVTQLADYFCRSKRTIICCLLYTSPSPRDKRQSRMPSSA